MLKQPGPGEKDITIELGIVKLHRLHRSEGASDVPDRDLGSRAAST
jgi:hypothetical protein